MIELIVSEGEGIFADGKKRVTVTPIGSPKVIDVDCKCISMKYIRNLIVEEILAHGPDLLGLQVEPDAFCVGDAKFVPLCNTNDGSGGIGMGYAPVQYYKIKTATTHNEK